VVQLNSLVGALPLPPLPSPFARMLEVLAKRAEVVEGCPGVGVIAVKASNSGVVGIAGIL